MIKRNINITLGVAMMLMVSCFIACNNETPDVPENMPIEIEAIIDNNGWGNRSRVTYSENDNRSIMAFSEGDTVRVDMWRLPKGQGSATAEPDIFRKQLMTYTGGEWDYSPKKFWSDTIGDRVAVFAYHLAGANCVVNENWDESSGYPTIDFKEPNKYSDILVAPLSLEGKGNLVDSKLPLKFRHVMARFEVYIRYWDDSVENPGEWTSLFLDNMTFWNYPRGAVFKGFISDTIPQWEITDYPTGKGINVTYDKTIPWGEEYVFIPDATQFHYPFVCKHASEQDGHIDNAKFGFTVYKQNEAGDKVNLTHDNDYFEKYFNNETGILGGFTYKFYITINPHNLVVLNIEQESNSEPWWTGTHTDTNVSF